MTTKAEQKKITPNKSQQKCIDSINGKYLVLAGPGTGKTFTIIERIKNILAKNITPEKILCLTFTDAAANEMKKRIEDDLNVVSSGVQIFTYHSFCGSIIDEFAEDFEIPANYKVITNTISKALIKECIDEIQPVYFRTEKNDPYAYISEIKKGIDAIKQNRLTKEQFFKNLKENPDWEPEIEKFQTLIEDVEQGRNKRYKKPPYDKKESAVKKVEQAKELWQFYELYQNKMAKQRYIDFNDMINMVLEKFEFTPSFLNQIANRYEYIMVDEYQDTNKSQNEIVFALSRELETQNVFVVGDDDQIIYRFQGAKLDTIENYLKNFPDTKIICLTENMRSTQSILDTARAVIAQDPLSLQNSNNFKDSDGNPINKNLIAKNEEIILKDKSVRFYKYADVMQEYIEIVKEIEALINSPECPIDNKTGKNKYSEIAILTRSNAEAQTFGEMLKARNIPFELKEGKDIFTIPAVNLLFFYIQFLIDPEMHSARIFELLMMKPFSINPKDYQILYKEVSKKKTFVEALRSIPKENFVDGEKFENFLKTYDYLREYMTKENIKNTVLEIGAKTGIFDYYLNTEINQTESIAGLKKFVDEAVGFSEVYKTSFLEEFYTYLKSIVDDEDKICTDKAPVTLNAIQLCTYHSSKGREFEYVYMPTLDTYKWESSSKSLKSKIPLDISEYKTDEEIKNEIKPSDLTKLMYVAMTRAKHTLRMSYPETIEGKSRKPTKYIVKIQDMLEKEPKPFEYNENSYWQQVNELLIKREYDYKKDFTELVKSYLNGIKHFSPTLMNKYLNCPRQYLYEKVFEFEVKDGNSDNLSYGTAVHDACEKFVEYAIKNKEYPSKEFFIDEFRKKLSNLPLSNFENRKNIEGRGEKALDKFYAFMISTPINEFNSFEEGIDFEDNGYKFYGKFDRIDKNKDGSYTLYDYKTGNAKTLKQVCPDGEKEDYYNQMALYKYIYEKTSGNKVARTVLVFPEDFEKNLEVNYTEDEIEAVIAKYKNVIDLIYQMEFEPTNNKNACKYCAYKDFCQTNIL